MLQRVACLTLAAMLVTTAAAAPLAHVHVVRQTHGTGGAPSDARSVYHASGSERHAHRHPHASAIHGHVREAPAPDHEHHAMVPVHGQADLHGGIVVATAAKGESPRAAAGATAPALPVAHGQAAAPDPAASGPARGNRPPPAPPPRVSAPTRAPPPA